MRKRRRAARLTHWDVTSRRWVTRRRASRCYAKHLLTLSEAAGSFDDIHRAYLNLSAVLDLDAGRPQDGLEVTRRGLERMRQLGLELAVPSTILRTSLAWGLWDLGHWQEAEQLVSEALKQALPASWEPSHSYWPAVSTWPEDASSWLTSRAKAPLDWWSR